MQALAHLLVGSLLSPWDPPFPILPVGHARVLTRGPHGWTHKELGAQSWEAGEIRMFNHWATGLRSELLAQVVVLQHQKLAPKRDRFW